MPKYLKTSLLSLAGLGGVGLVITLMLTKTSPQVSGNPSQKSMNANSVVAINQPLNDLVDQYLNTSTCFDPSNNILQKNASVALTDAIARLRNVAGPSSELSSLCSDPSLGTLFIGVVTKTLTPGEVPATTQNDTVRLFPTLGPTMAMAQGEYREYQFYVYTWKQTILKRGNQQQTFFPGTPRLVQKLVWGDALEACAVEDGSFSKTGTIIIDCGGGDGGSYQQDRIKLDFFTGTAARLDHCEKKGNIPEGQPVTLSCT